MWGFSNEVMDEYFSEKHFKLTKSTSTTVGDDSMYDSLYQTIDKSIARQALSV